MLEMIFVGRRGLLKAADSILTLFLFFPLMVCYWRGIWDLVGYYVNPDWVTHKDWRIFAIGSCTILGYALYPMLERMLGNRRHSCSYVIITRICMYIQGCFYMSYWRSVWVLAETYLGNDWQSALLTSCVCWPLLLLMRCFRNLVFPPFYIALDTRNDLLTPATRFRTKPEEQPVLYVLDSLFTHFVVITMGITCWQANWNLYSAWLYPEDELKSDVVALAVGVCGALVFFSIQDILAGLSRAAQSRSWWCRLLVDDVFYILLHAIQIFLWRGAWNLNARFLFSDQLVGGWINHIVGSAGLMILQLFSYAGAVGCSMDAAEDDDQPFFPIGFLQVYLNTQQDDVDASHKENKNVVSGMSLQCKSTRHNSHKLNPDVDGKVETET